MDTEQLPNGAQEEVKSNLKPYIGAKVIMGEPMSDIEFGRRFKKTTPEENQEAQAGYHVQYSNPDGSKYDSWSPKSQFERAYRQLHDDEMAMLS